MKLITSDGHLVDGRHARAWKPGQSGNPSGRPRHIPLLRAYLRAHTADAVSALVSIIADKDAPPTARIVAACAVLDRGWGKPVSANEVENEMGNSDAENVQVMSDHLAAVGITQQQIETLAQMKLDAIDAENATPPKHESEQECRDDE